MRVCWCFCLLGAWGGGGVDWTARFIEWFEDLGFLGAAGEPTKAAADVHEYETNPAGRRTLPGQPPAGDSLGLTDNEKSEAGGNFGTGAGKVQKSSQ